MMSAGAVERILERPEPMDYIVVETTGLADPRRWP